MHKTISELHVSYHRQLNVSLRKRNVSQPTSATLLVPRAIYWWAAQFKTRSETDWGWATTEREKKLVVVILWWFFQKKKCTRETRKHPTINFFSVQVYVSAIKVQHCPTAENWQLFAIGLDCLFSILYGSYCFGFLWREYSSSFWYLLVPSFTASNRQNQMFENLFQFVSKKVRAIKILLHHIFRELPPFELWSCVKWNNLNESFYHVLE